MKTAISVVSILLLFPIRFYLAYYLLESVNATELPMFLFWCTIPLALLIAIIGEIIKPNNK